MRGDRLPLAGREPKWLATEALCLGFYIYKYVPCWLLIGSSTEALCIGEEKALCQEAEEALCQGVDETLCQMVAKALHLCRDFGSSLTS